MKLDQLPIGQPATIVSVGGEGALRRRLLDMGLTPRASITIRKTAPMGDPIELHVRSYELTIRLDDAKQIEVMPCGASPEADRQAEHPLLHRHRFHGNHSR
ncbi:FeoA family protein [Acidaminobacterium chupaoyuni]